jgi:hypothetical protein
MNARGLSFQREYEMDIYYKGERIGGRRVDYFVENCINRLNHDLPDLHDAKDSKIKLNQFKPGHGNQINPKNQGSDK